MGTIYLKNRKGEPLEMRFNGTLSFASNTTIDLSQELLFDRIEFSDKEVFDESNSQ